MDEKCVWTLVDAFDFAAWETTCGQAFILDEGTPAENDMNYCCYCGKPLAQLIREKVEEEG